MCNFFEILDDRYKKLRFLSIVNLLLTIISLSIDFKDNFFSAVKVILTNEKMSCY